MVLAKEDKEYLDTLFQEASGRQSPVLFLLHRIQARYGRIPHASAKYISEKLGVPLTQIYSAATFYEEFSQEGRGRVVIRVCRGVVCHSRGSRDILDSFCSELGIGPNETTEDGRFTLLESSCMGQCDGSPAVMVNDEVHRDLDRQGVSELVRRMKGGG
ncbi:MAG: NAD(P)H-dependent oxidoreductase subunit E [Thermoplasmatota archaeon]